jgi:hypothetical protein
MMRPFRPAFENLEKRDVCAAGPLAVGSDHAWGHSLAARADYPLADDMAAHVDSSQASGDRSPAVVDVVDGTSNTLTALLLPYIEQENLYKQRALIGPPDDSTRDAIFADLDANSSLFPSDAERSQIIAILIGLKAPRDTTTGIN